MRGSVKWFNRSKGIGFIRVPFEKDAFFHITNIADEYLKVLCESEAAEGENVEFEMRSSPKKPGLMEAYKICRATSLPPTKTGRVIRGDAPEGAERSTAGS